MKFFKLFVLMAAAAVANPTLAAGDAEAGEAKPLPAPLVMALVVPSRLRVITRSWQARGKRTWSSSSRITSPVNGKTPSWPVR